MRIDKIREVLRPSSFQPTSLQAAAGAGASAGAGAGAIAANADNHTLNE